MFLYAGVTRIKFSVLHSTAMKNNNVMECKIGIEFTTLLFSVLPSHSIFTTMKSDDRKKVK